MTKRFILTSLLTALLVVSCGAGNGLPAAPAPQPATSPHHPAKPDVEAAIQAAQTTYVVVAWSELGMHCMDGKDYSIFSILPPYNNLKAQVFKKGEPPVAVSTGITVTYTALKDASGSINTISSTKTNFWTYVNTLFLSNPVPDTGLANYKVQSKTAQNMTYNSKAADWEAIGIPTVPYDDKLVSNAFPMVTITAKDTKGNILSTAKIVMPVSDEISCGNCHASNSDAPAKPAAGWVNNPDPAKDMKLNILRKHDDRWNITPYLATLAKNGYKYQAKLYDTANAGTPILCAACHATNALGAPGIAGINSETADMHTLHGPQINPLTGISLDNATDNLTGCYLCHPGVKAQCERGAMSPQTCKDCHGNPTAVGASTRQGWLDLPACQMCHQTSQRYTNAFASNGIWRTSTDSTFATNNNVPLPGKTLFRYSTGHGGAYCAACHGSQHAEFPSLNANDNVYPTQKQGYIAKLTECTICHTNVQVTQTGGPHGMHNLGQSWVDSHHDYANDGKCTACAYCHGADYKGTFLTLSKVSRTFTVGDQGKKTFSAGHQFSCYDCHNGPTGS